MHLERREALSHRHELHEVDVHVRRSRGDPEYGFGNILRRERGKPLVDRRSAGGIAPESDERELGPPAHARLDASHPHPCAVQIAPQVEAELVDEGLGRALTLPPG